MFKQELYDCDFQGNRDNMTEYAAKKILSRLMNRESIHSVCDVGCGVGTWIKTFKSLVGNDSDDVYYVGIDGKYYEDVAVIPRDCFLEMDLLNEIKLDKKYDLCICLEVAEHLPEYRAESFVRELTAISDRVLFSAAFWKQGGTGHVNENTAKYWKKLFKKCGFDAIDCVRPHILMDKRIPWWYKQNAYLFVNYDAQSLKSDCNPVLSLFADARKMLYFLYRMIRSI